MEKYWYYLDEENFLIRQYSVLPFINNYSNIIEIGCGKNPISKFLINKKITLIEPAFDIEKDDKNNITHIKNEIDDVDISKLILDKYCLVIFGLDWGFEGKTKELFDKSELAIMETITDLEKHKDIIESIKKYKKPWIEFDLCIFDDNSYPEDSWPPRCNRKIMIFKND